jgi:type II secretory pathway pseudopilin PulG
MDIVTKRHQEGLTFIEILVIVAILAMLIAVLIPAVITIRVRMRVACTRAAISSIDMACEEFKKDMDFYPPDELYGDWQMPSGPGAALIAPYRSDPAFKGPGAARDVLRDPQNGTTKGLVHLLGSSFSISGKSYGPYMKIKLYGLKPPGPRDTAPRYFKPPAGVTVPLPGTSAGYPTLILTDYFGNAFVYDSHFPESKRLLIEFNAVHNASSFDLYSSGPVYNIGPDGWLTDEDPNKAPGNNEDDINNWR